MWVLVARIIPISKECRPKWLSIYWALPWIDVKQIQKAFIRYILTDFRDLNYNIRRVKKDIPDKVFQNIHDKEKYPKEYTKQLERFAKATSLLDFSGISPNPYTSTIGRVMNVKHRAFTEEEYMRIMVIELECKITDKIFKEMEKNGLRLCWDVKKPVLEIAGRKAYIKRAYVRAKDKKNER